MIPSISSSEERKETPTFPRRHTMDNLIRRLRLHAFPGATDRHCRVIVIAIASRLRRRLYLRWTVQKNPGCIFCTLQKNPGCMRWTVQKKPGCILCVGVGVGVAGWVRLLARD